MIRLTYGELPTFEKFEECFNDETTSGIYEIRNCRELDAVYSGGNVDFDCEGLWSFLNECVENLDANHELYELCSCILYTLGIEWV